MQLHVIGPLWYWKGPAPHFFVRVSAEQTAAIKAIAPAVTYGWGVIPVQVQIGDTHWSTSLIPKDGVYLVPIRAAVRRAEKLADDAIVSLTLDIG